MVKVNRAVPHLVVLSEDDATHSLAVGFSDKVSGAMNVGIKPAGGWLKVLEQFKDMYVAYLKKWDKAHVLMLIDFDHEVTSRMAHFKKNIPTKLAGRVYILGAEDEAETLACEQKLSFGLLGEALADECRSHQYEHWVCPQLKHNQSEVARLRRAVWPFLL